MKLLAPRLSPSTATVILSNYGGGVVQGDHCGLEILCTPASRLFIGTQAYTRIYRSEGIESSQWLTGRLQGSSMVAFMPDPVVPQADSRFHQHQEWYLGRMSTLILCDGHHAGRLARGEWHQYGSYRSSLRVFREERPVLWDNYHSTGASHGSHSPSELGAFGSFGCVMNLYLVGEPGSTVFEQLVDIARIACGERLADLDAGAFPLNAKQQIKGFVWAFSRPRDELAVVRAMALSDMDADPFRRLCCELVAQKAFLDLRPWERRY